MFLSSIEIFFCIVISTMLFSQDSRSSYTNRTLYIDNRGQTVPTDPMSASSYSSYDNEGSRTWFSPDEDYNEFESIRILGNAHVALHPDLTRYKYNIIVFYFLSNSFLLNSWEKNMNQN